MVRFAIPAAGTLPAGLPGLGASVASGVIRTAPGVAGDGFSEVFFRAGAAFFEAGWTLRGQRGVPFAMKPGVYLFAADAEPPVGNAAG